MPTTNITLTITTPQGVSIAEAIDLFCQHHGYQELINGNPNPESKAAFSKRVIAAKVAQQINNQRLENARKAAQDLENQNQTITVE